MNNLSDLIILITILSASLFLGLLVFLKNIKDSKNINFFCLSMGVIAWNASAYVSEIVDTDFGKIFLSKLSYLFAMLALYFAVAFMHGFLEVKNNRVIKIVNAVSALVVSVFILFTNLIISGTKNTDYGFVINFGHLQYLLLATIIIYVFQFLFYPFVIHRASRGIKRNQIKYMFAGFFAYIFSVILFSFILKFITGSDQYYKYGNYSAVFLLGFTAYAIIKHRALDNQGQQP